MSKVSVCFAEHNIIKGKNNETVTEQVSEVIEITKNYHNKREPYDYYEISVNTIPDGYEVIILYVKTNGKLELFATNDMDKLKCELALLVQTENYKTINVLLRRNPNTMMVNTGGINEEIQRDDRSFTKRKGVLKFESEPRPRV
ncbi:hypothetical protein M9Y10_035651 [Tritrichomonas musculus]|uniref:Uncharacterized protein n=1 Tax=Tritrichomonas musculus TaxID=1915356 RepID=A0ABR2GX55_9EUKA